MQRMKRLLLLLCVIGLVAGCSSASKVIAAGVQVELLRVQRPGSGPAKVTWRVNNPNVVHYLFTRSVLKVTLDGVAVGTVTDTSNLGVPAQSQAEFTSDLVVAGPAASQALDRAVAQGTAAYQIDCSLWMLLIDDDYEKIAQKASGTVAVSAQ